MKKIIIFVSILFCFSCSLKSKTDKSLKNVTKDSTNQMKEEAKIEELPLLDTTIFIKSAKQKRDSPKAVSRQMVIDDLYCTLLFFVRYDWLRIYRINRIENTD